MLKTFRIGGIHPPENKLSAGKKIVTLPPPRQVVIPLSQHAGAPAKLLVAKGNEVKTGMLIAEASGFISANIHSSVSGVVSKIEDVADAGGYKKPAVVIDVKDDIWEDGILPDGQTLPVGALTAEEIIGKIKNAGIVGLGGATFPAHVKLTPPPGCKAEVLIINGAECEPYLTADHALMLEKSEEILTGIQLLMRACKVEKAYIGIENNKKEAIDKLVAIVSHYPGIEIVPLKVRYPQGGEKQMIDSIIGRQVPSGALPVSVGAIVNNIGTLFAVYEAVAKNKPLIERVVTVTGKQVKNPCNLRVRIGTPFRYLIDYAGGMPDDTGKIIGGGPMMGRTLLSADIPITKGASGILLLPSPEAKRQMMRSCIRCA
jgi:electron transport complex protein RnfC